MMFSPSAAKRLSRPLGCLLLVVVACVAVPAEAKPAVTIVNNSGDGLSTSLTNGILTCDKLTCPAKTEKCTIWANNKRLATEVDTSVQCLSASGAVLNERNSTAPAPAGEQRVNNYAELSTVSGSTTCIGCAGDTPAEIVRQMKAEFVHNQQQLAAEMEALHQRMVAMQASLGHLADGFVGKRR